MTLIRKIKQSTFLRHNTIFFVGTVGVGILNYIYYPVLGRLMDPATFGEVQALVSLFLQFTVFLQVLSMVVVNIVVNYHDKLQANRTIFELEKLAILAGAILVVLSLVASPLLQNVLQFESTAPFVATALALLVSIPLSFRSGFVRAHKKFTTVSLTQGLGASSKIVLSTILVAIGLSTLGAILGLVAAQLLALAYAAFWATRLGFVRPEGTHYRGKINLQAIRGELMFAGAVLGSSLSVMLFMSMDALFVKYYFDPETAGLYAGVATVARAIFFFTASIAFVLLPSVKLNNTPRHNQMLLIKSLVLLGATGGIAVLACIWQPKLIIELLMGSGYTTYQSLLPLLAITIFIISILNLLFAYFLALRRNRVALIGIIGFVVMVAAMIGHHDSLRAVVNNMLLGSIVTMCLLMIYTTISTKRAQKRRTIEYDSAETNIDRDTDLQ